MTASLAPKATKAAAAHSMEKRIARLESDKVDDVRADKVLKVRFPPPPTPGRTVIEVDGLAKSYGGPPIFTDVTFDLGRGERLLVLGLNPRRLALAVEGLTAHSPTTREERKGPRTDAPAGPMAQPARSVASR